MGRLCDYCAKQVAERAHEVADERRHAAATSILAGLCAADDPGRPGDLVVRAVDLADQLMAKLAKGRK